MENKNYQKIHSYIRLKSMTDFVLQNSKEPYVEGTKYKDIVSYANFLKKPLKLGYFIPCDEEGDILEEPTNYEKRLLNMMTEYNDEVYTYYQAKAKVLFEGFEYDKENDWVTYNEFARFFVSELQNGKVEDLFKLIKDEITLTETSKKEIGYER